MIIPISLLVFGALGFTLLGYTLGFYAGNFVRKIRRK